MLNFTGEAIASASINVDLSALPISHLDVREWYLGTINPDDTKWRTGSGDEGITLLERTVWYNTSLATYNPASSDQDLGNGGGLGEGWYWSVAGAGYADHPQKVEGPIDPNEHHDYFQNWNFAATNFVDPNDDLSLFNGDFEYRLYGASVPIYPGIPPFTVLPTRLPAYLNGDWSAPWGSPPLSIEDVGGTHHHVAAFHEAGPATALVHQALFVRPQNPVLSLEFEPVLSAASANLTLEVWARTPSDREATKLLNIDQDELWASNVSWTRVDIDLSAVIDQLNGGFVQLEVRLEGSLPASSWINIDNLNLDFQPGDWIQTSPNTPSGEPLYAVPPQTVNGVEVPGVPVATGVYDNYQGHAGQNVWGTITEGPVKSANATWWRVDFGPGLYSGWIQERWIFERYKNYVKGIDISYAQGELSAATWQVVQQAGYQFAIIRASDGYGTLDFAGSPTRVPNYYFITNTSTARSRGLFVGSYAIGRPNTSSNPPGGHADAWSEQDARNEADYYWDAIAQYVRPGTSGRPWTSNTTLGTTTPANILKWRYGSVPGGSRSSQSLPRCSRTGASLSFISPPSPRENCTIFSPGISEIFDLWATNTDEHSVGSAPNTSNWPNTRLWQFAGTKSESEKSV